MSSKVVLYWLFFCEDIGSVIRDGTNTGFYHFNGNNFLQLTPGTGFSTGTYSVDCLYLGYAQTLQEKGRFRRIQ